MPAGMELNNAQYFQKKKEKCLDIFSQTQRRKAMFILKKIITIVLLVLTLGGLLAGKWVGPFLSKILSKIIATPVGAVLTTLALIVFTITIINFVINLARIKTN